MKINQHFNILLFILIGIVFSGLSDISAQEIIQPALDVNLNASAGSESQSTDIPNALQNNDPNNFIGAELYAELKSDGPTKIILKKYVDSTANITADNHIVVIHEREAKTLFKILHLKLEKQVELDGGISPDCGEFFNRRQHIKAVYYSADVMLPIMPGGYDVVWMFKMGEFGLDLPPEEEAGLSLTLLIPDPMLISSNVSPELNGLTQYDFCSGQSYQIPLLAEDADGDYMGYSLSPAYSYWASSEVQIPYPELYNDTILSSNSKMDLLPKKILFTRPPFKPRSEMSRPDPNPLEVKESDVLTIDNKEKTINFKPVSTSTKLVGITIAEQRNGKIISEHQAVFLLNIQ